MRFLTLVLVSIALIGCESKHPKQTSLPGGKTCMDGWTYHRELWAYSPDKYLALDDKGNPIRCEAK